MNKDAWIINSAERLNHFLAHIKTEFTEHRFLRITIRAGIKRSLDANSLSHVWYGIIARNSGDSARNVKRYCKLHFGVVIRRRDESFGLFYNNYIKNALSYEQKLEAMDHIAITSELSVAEMSEYLNAMQAHYAENDIILEAE